MTSAHLAIDLGASSGRALLGLLEGDPLKLTLHETHRFEHTPLESPAGPVWDFTGIVNHVFEGLRKGVAAAREAGVELSSVGVDTWGVDWGLVSPKGELVGLPHCYRDPANLAARTRVLSRIEGGGEALFRRIGIQLHPFDTLFQIDSRYEASPELFVPGSRLLLLPDLLHYWLSGKMTNERTNASTGSLLSIESGDWDLALVESLGLPSHLFGPITEPGTNLGPIRAELAEQLQAPKTLEVVVPATHDTGSAIAAVPVENADANDWAYLSSGTWSLLGMELEAPIATPAALQGGFTNEIGVLRNGKPTVRFLRNIGGLWLLQELRRDLERRGEKHSFAELARQAEGAPAFRTLVDPNAPDLAAPGGSIEKLQGHATRTKQPTPTTPGELTRCCLESLALCYAETVDRLEELTGRKIERLHAVGGGIQNQLLNRLTASAIDRPVFTGPIEATAIGNALVQAVGMGRIKDLNELRAIVARSLPMERLDPDPASGDWNEAQARFQSIIQTT